ncbi:MULTISPECIES: hypothetical protein [unclassified Rhizobacter]|uniref:hypothetical protein n=1 Tax=unclassified Rhizobacter TaxID=2640088 RepID=UPI0006FA623A|nr:MULTISPECIES: hypothetical protein [unclassified Rhizobacter]KQU78168.1 hypothetical protein ASC88_20320 [Rhizobacter sp. Root29]KQW15914.1 hypothetical protein ASC98_01540 [Rhizobacter sp. Root1238]KRB25029.1 hypothetical protein ASE08_02275 [Rhizobacter sp. Root16D2]
MTSPIDYTIDVQTPFLAALQGYQGGAAIRNDQQQQTMLAQQQAAAQQQQQLLSRLASNPNATANDYAAVMTQIPSASEHLARAWSTKNTAQQQSQASDLLQWGAAIKSGRPDIAAEMLNKRADAMEARGGSTPESQVLRVHAQTIEAHPEFALGLIQALLSANPNGKDAANTLASFGTEQRAQDAAPVELATKKAEATIKGVEAANAPEKTALENTNVRSQIQDRAGRLALDKDKLQSDVELELYKLKQKQGELPEYVAKGVESAVTDAIAAQQSGARMMQLADQITNAASEMGTGWKGSLDEFVKRATGTQNELTRIRSEFSRIVTPAAMAAYKKVASGPTSDKDIDTAMIGVPKDTDPPERMASFLRGVAKLQAYDVALNNAKSEWLGAVRSLGKSKADVEIDGVKVPAGTTFKDFTDQYVERKVTQQAAADAAKVVQGRSYMRFAQPPQQANNAPEPAAQ